MAVTENARDRTITAVIGALESGAIANWLLVYDNAAQPLDLQRYLPLCPPGGHIIITSRLQNWPGYIEADSIEVPPFTDEEAITFLRRRVPALARHGRLTLDEDDSRASEAGRLAAALGHLPIAVEHAAAYLTETSQSVDDYLIRFGQNAHRRRPALGRSGAGARCRRRGEPVCDPRHLDHLRRTADDGAAGNELRDRSAHEPELSVVGDVGELEGQSLLGQGGERGGNRAEPIGRDGHVNAELGAVGPHPGQRLAHGVAADVAVLRGKGAIAVEEDHDPRQ